MATGHASPGVVAASSAAPGVDHASTIGMRNPQRQRRAADRDAETQRGDRGAGLLDRRAERAQRLDDERDRAAEADDGCDERGGPGVEGGGLFSMCRQLARVAKKGTDLFSIFPRWLPRLIRNLHTSATSTGESPWSLDKRFWL